MRKITLIAAFIACAAIGYIGKTFFENLMLVKQLSYVTEPHSAASLRHLACIMDGNRRWAKQKQLKPWYGHKEGIEAVKKTIQFCLEKNIPYLSLYTFSLENFKRSADENNYLFDLILKQSEKDCTEFKENGVRISFIGDRSKFPTVVKSVLERVERETADQTRLHVCCMFCYGSRQEIAAAARLIAEQVQAGTLAPEAITPELFSKYLQTADIPDPDLIIRTGGYSRLSNFLLYQAAYTQLYITDCLWPDLTKLELQKAYDVYCQVQKNFGA